MPCRHLNVVFLNLFPSLFSVALVFIKAGPMGFCYSVFSPFKSLLAPLSQCMLNYKGLELVPFPKELFTHTDISFAGSHTAFEGPSVWGHVSSSGLWTWQLSPHLPAVLVQNSHQQPEMSGIETWLKQSMPLNLTQIFFLEL